MHGKWWTVKHEFYLPQRSTLLLLWQRLLIQFHLKIHKPQKTRETRIPIRLYSELKYNTRFYLIENMNFTKEANSRPYTEMQETNECQKINKMLVAHDLSFQVKTKTLESEVCILQQRR